MQDCLNSPEREREIQQTVLAIETKYRKNTILKTINPEESATVKDHYTQTGGHKA